MKEKRPSPLTHYFTKEELDSLTEEERKILESASSEEPPEVTPEEAAKAGEEYLDLIREKLKKRRIQ